MDNPCKGHIYRLVEIVIKEIGNEMYRVTVNCTTITI